MRGTRRPWAVVAALVSLVSLVGLAGSAGTRTTRTATPAGPAPSPVRVSPPPAPAVTVRVTATASASPTNGPLDQLHLPAAGQVSLDVDGSERSSPDQRPVPIASIAKVMTAYVVLRRTATATITVTSADVRDTALRRAGNQSVVTVATGERLSERQALEAILVPSANNVAAMLARHVAGSETAFVTIMNATAAQLGMTSTTYTDPSGYDAGTVSTAADQLILLRAALAVPELAQLVAERQAVLPVAGVVHNNDALLGIDGFTGVKTGSSYAARGCFAFRSVRPSGDVVTGVVLDQPGTGPAAFIAAGLDAARALVDQVR